MNPFKMHIIKLGGSLEKSKNLVDSLNCIAKNSNETVVIVSGGGAFADEIRMAQKSWQFNDTIAHEMAILAMQQMALLFHSLRPDFKKLNSVYEIKLQTKNQSPIIWSPDINELNQAGIKASWDVTSDSLAAWLATQLQATELIIVKVAHFSSSNIAQLVEQGIIDREFPKFIKNANFETQIIHVDKFNE